MKERSLLPRDAHTHKCGEEREQWRCSLAHLLRSVSGLDNRLRYLVVDLVKARAQGPHSLRTCSLRMRVPIRSRCPGTTSLDKRLRIITRGADVVTKRAFLSSGRKRNFCGPYRGREILNVRPRPQNTFRVLCPLYKSRNTHFAAFEQKNYIYYHGRNL